MTNRQVPHFEASRTAATQRRFLVRRALPLHALAALPLPLLLALSLLSVPLFLALVRTSSRRDHTKVRQGFWPIYPTKVRQICPVYPTKVRQPCPTKVKQISEFWARRAASAWDFGMSATRQSPPRRRQPGAMSA